MPHLITCPQGHQWEAASNDETQELAQPLCCPVCGARAPAAPDAHASWTNTDDELPPRPRPAPAGLAETSPVSAAAGWAWPTVAGYEILEELGEGGMGVVYKARQIALNRVVALKMIRGSHASPEELARFRTEAEAVARLQHPNIVQIYEVGQQDGRPFFSLEYVAGGSLDQLQAPTLMPVRQATALMETLARAVHYAHERGIVHRDLKPANILLVSGGVVSGESCHSPLTTHHSPLTTHQPKITDFGLAKRLDVGTDKTRSGLILGTPSYMAPEQAQGKGVGPAADIHALGAILYELLTGRPPFQAETPMDILLQVVSADPVAPCRLQPRLPRDLETICLKCLNKDPRRRYASANDLADDLHRFLNREPIRARPIGLAERAVKWVRRQPAQAALAAVCALVVVGLLAGGLWYADLEKQRAEEARRDRDRALRAERESYAHTAELAMRRGDWRAALPYLDKALEGGHPDPVGMRLSKVRALVAINDVPRAAVEIDNLSRHTDLSDRQRALVLLWKGDLAISRSSVHADEALKLIRQALNLGLPEADRAYADGLLARSSRAAVEHFRRVLELDPYHPRANGALIMTLILLGRLPEARNHLFFATSFFPEDPTFMLLHAMTDALDGHRQAALAGIEQAGSRIKDRRQLAAARDIVEVLSEFRGVEHMIGDPDAGPFDLLVKMAPGFFKIALLLPADQRTKASPTQTPLLLPLPPKVGKAMRAMFLAIPWARISRKQSRVFRDGLQSHPEGLLYLLYAVTVAQQQRWADAEEAYLLAYETPAVVPVQRTALFYAIHAELMQANQLRGERRRQLYRKALANTRKLVALGNLRPYQSHWLAQLATNENELDLARWILGEWAQQDRKNLVMLRLRLAVEFRGGAYEQVLATAQTILARLPHDKVALEYREAAGVRMWLQGA